MVDSDDDKKDASEETPESSDDNGEDVEPESSDVEVAEGETDDSEEVVDTSEDDEPDSDAEEPDEPSADDVDDSKDDSEHSDDLLDESDEDSDDFLDESDEDSDDFLDESDEDSDDFLDDSDEDSDDFLDDSGDAEADESDAEEMEVSDEDAEDSGDTEDDSTDDEEGSHETSGPDGDETSSKDTTDDDASEESLEDGDETTDEGSTDEDEEPSGEEESVWSPTDDESASDGTSDRVAAIVDTVSERRPDAADERLDALRDEVPGFLDEYDESRIISAAVVAVDAEVDLDEILGPETGYERREPGVAAFFDHPDELLKAARATRDSHYEQFDCYSPFPIHGMDEAMGLGRSWIPWVTFGAGTVGLLCACAMEFGMMTFDWPMIIGGKPFAPWPAFVPIMFELTVLIGGVTTGVVMLRAAGCFEAADVIDPRLTDDRFALWISGEDSNYDRQEAVAFVEQMEPTEIRTYTEEH